MHAELLLIVRSITSTPGALWVHWEAVVSNIIGFNHVNH